MVDWAFLTNHLHALYCVARRSGSRLVDIADCVGVRERAAHRLVSDLVEAGYLSRYRVGTRSYYEVHAELPLRRELHADIAVGDILDVLRKHDQQDRALE